MTIKDCIDIVDNIKPNQYTIRDKVMWLSFLEQIIINEVLKTHEGYDGRYDNFEGYSEDRLTIPLIVPSPYDRLYTEYLKMMIDKENGEIARYNNSMASYNTYMMEYRKHYNKTHMPLDITAKRREVIPQRKSSVGLSEAEYENLKRDMTYILTEYFSNAVSDDKLYAIVTGFVQNNIELLRGKNKKDGIGIRTPEGGTILGDLINNVAAGVHTMATGSGCIAGMRGYFYSDIQFGKAMSGGKYGPCKITLTKVQPENIEEAKAESPFDIGYMVGDKVSVINNLKYPDCATITAIEKNVITVDSLPFNTIKNMCIPPLSVATDDYSVFVAEKPLSGDVPLGYGAFASGEDAIALERASAALGRLVKAIGQYSFAANRETVAAYCAAAFGHRSRALGGNSFAINYRTEAREAGTFAGGLGTIANTPYQATLGKYNIKDVANLFAFVLGNGTSDTNRNNAFTVDWEGNVWANGEIRSGDSRAVTEKDVDDALQAFIGTYTAKELVAGITAEVGVKFIYEEDIDAFSVVVDETTVVEKTPVAQKARIAAELLKADKTRFIFYSGDSVICTASVKNTLHNRGLLLIEKG